MATNRKEKKLSKSKELGQNDHWRNDHENKKLAM